MLPQMIPLVAELAVNLSKVLIRACIVDVVRKVASIVFLEKLEALDLIWALFPLAERTPNR